MHQLPLVFQDGWLMVINKPARLLSVPGRTLADSLIQRVNRFFPEARIVHRLDFDTSGLIVLARDSHTHRHLSTQFRERRVEKRYVALCRGRMTAATGWIHKPLCTDWPYRPKQKVDWQDGKPAITQWHLLACSHQYSRLWLRPLTGRSHQLRLHLASIGFPILGDPFYETCPRPSEARRLMLHAAQLAFAHPFFGTPLKFHAPVPF